MNIRDIIDNNKQQRNAAKVIIEYMIEDNRLKGPDGYGVIFEGYTMARYKPWEGKYQGRMGFGMSEDRMYMIQQFANIAPFGVAIECGVYTGWVTNMLLNMDTFHIVYAFDTFKGIASARPDEMFANGDMSVESEYLDVMKRIDGAKVVIGEVPYTLEALKHENAISFVHLDMDVYEPTIAALHYIYPKMALDGVIILDDYGNWLTPGIKQAVDEFVVYYDAKFIYLPTGQGVIFA